MLNYTKSEKKVFKETLSLILDDLDKIWEKSSLEKIEVPVVFKEVDQSSEYSPDKKLLFVMSRDGYLIRKYDYGAITDDIWFAQRTKFGKLDRKLYIQEIDVLFIKAYQEIRANILERLAKSDKEKAKNISAAQELQELMKKEIEVELNLPPSKNPHTVELKTEKGKQVSEINFGHATIKLITNGELILIDNRDGKQKIKGLNSQ